MIREAHHLRQPIGRTRDTFASVFALCSLALLAQAQMPTQIESPRLAQLALDIAKDNSAATEGFWQEISPSAMRH